MFKLKLITKNSNMKNLKTQIGEAVTADFSENTWTFELGDDMKIRAGEFAILPKNNYDNIIKLLKHFNDSDPDDSMPNEIFTLLHETIEKLNNDE